jgi:hypothetical protein
MSRRGLRVDEHRSDRLGSRKTTTASLRLGGAGRVPSEYESIRRRCRSYLEGHLAKWRENSLLLSC